MKDDDNDDDDRCEIRSGRLRGPSLSCPREITSRVSEFKNLDTHANLLTKNIYLFRLISNLIGSGKNIFMSHMTIFCNLFVG